MSSSCVKDPRVRVRVMLPYLLFLAILFPATWATLRVDLTHVDSGRSFTKRELLTRMAVRSTARAASLAASAQAATAPVSGSTAEYLVHLGIGTPSPQAAALTLDTGSDLVWTQCACACTACFKQPFPVYDPHASGTSRTVPCTDPICGLRNQSTACSVKRHKCHYHYPYADKSFTTGTIMEDTFAFSGSAVPGLRFGCGMNNSGVFASNESGIAGFGRGPQSLPSQLNVSVFSYCFTPIVEPGTGRSPVFLGKLGNLGANAQSTPFAPSPPGRPSLYYLSLKGVTVGKTLLPFNASAFAPRANGLGGAIIDSGTSITRFPQPVFQSLWEAFVSQVPLPAANASDTGGLLCFSTAQGTGPKKVPVPKLVLHLEGADWELPRQNYVLDVEDDDGAGGGGLCVVLLSAGDLDLTMLGNFQQQNMHIVYDLEANKMVFAPASCHQM